MREVCIVSAKRTPFGRFLGSLSRLSAVDLACHAGEAALGNLDRSSIDQVIVGNILSAGQGMNMARQVGVRLGIPVSATAFTVNMMCASGMQAISLAVHAIASGESDIILCGGSESMSQAPHLVPRFRTGLKLGDGKLVDSILRDGLVDSFDQRHMALTAEALASDYSLSRAEQDAFAASSQARAAAATESGVFADELAPLDKLDRDEHPRPDTTAESLAALEPAFDPEGSVTAGNASGINDGSAMLLLSSRETAEARGWPILSVVSGTASVGCEPARMGLGPVHAIRKLLDRSSVGLAEFDQVEINEAFAAQVLACLRELELPAEAVNPNGGAIALGHPIGASGARIVTHLAHRIASGEIRTGIASLCVGGGMGAAISLTSP